LELLSDGVLAIAATLLDIGVSVDAPGGELGAALQHPSPRYAAYAVSFLSAKPAVRTRLRGSSREPEWRGPVRSTMQGRPARQGGGDD